MITKQGDNYIIKSESGKTLGSYPTKEKALRRLAQIEFFKHNKEKQNSKLKKGK